MKIAVCLKQVPDTETIIKIKDETSIDESGIKWIINPYDEFAVEEAIRIKEKIEGSTFTVYSIGPQRTETAMRTCLALGADRVVHLDDPLFLKRENLLAATVLATALGRESYDLILFGKQAIDDDGCMIAGMVASLMSLAYVSEINKLEFPQGASAPIISASRLMDGALEVWEAELPAVLSCQKGLNEPRLPILKGIMQAKKKTIEKISAEELGLSGEQLAKLGEGSSRIKLELPPPRAQCKVLDDSDASINETVRWLKEEVRVI